MFIDETGFLMAPFVRRTWAPRGHTPIFHQRTASHRKVSVIGALRLTPKNRRARFYFRLHPDTNVTGDLVRQFLRHLLYQIRGHIVLVWDRYKPHRSRLVREFIDSSPRLHVFFLPPYAPELNPVEPIWSYLKTNALANHAAMGLEDLTRTSRYQSRLLQKKPDLLQSLARNSPLFSCPT